jgi:hypothetical protein
VIDRLAAGLIVLALFCSLLGACFWVVGQSCEAKARKMGMAHSYAPLQGCMIEHAPGRWVDIKRYRAGRGD